MKRVERIAAMEEKLNRARASVTALEAALADYRAVKKDIAALERYLGSAAWLGDLAADEAGRLPKDLRRGVLSEDGIYDLLVDNDAVRKDMASLARRKR